MSRVSDPAGDQLGARTTAHGYLVRLLGLFVVVAAVLLADVTPGFGSARAQTSTATTAAGLSYGDGSALAAGSTPTPSASDGTKAGSTGEAAGFMAHPGVTPAPKGIVDEALSGGRHSGFLQNYAGRSRAEIERGIGSLQRQIDDHRAWIEDPYRKPVRISAGLVPTAGDLVLGPMSAGRT